MLKQVSTYTASGLSATSWTSQSASDVWQGEFDLALLGVSWDVRSTAVTFCSSTVFKNAILVDPTSKDEVGHQAKHAQQLLTWLYGCSTKVVHIHSDSDDLRATLRSAIDTFARVVSSQRKPVRLFIDITTCPRLVSLGFMKEVLFSGLVEEVVLGYSEGLYPPADPSYGGMEELAFNDGILQAIPVPGMYGEFEPSKEKFFLISVGFDGWKTLNLVVRKEPERVGLLLGSPGVEPSYEQRTLAANKALIERYAIEEDGIVRAQAGDAIGAWRQLAESRVERFEHENVYYMCAGNKPHSVALALRAMTCPSATLYYNKPVQHSKVEVEFAKVFWSYVVRPADGAVLI